MKTSLAVFIAALIALSGAGVASAQMMGSYGSQSDSYGPGMMNGYEQATTSQQTASTTSGAGDAAGAAIWNKLQTKQVSCSQLTTADFAALGDYYMGQMMGSYHDQMDQYMTQSLGQSGDEQTHIALGERLSGCNTTAAYPAGTSGYFPMMMGGWGMMGGYGGPFGGYGMMYGGYGYWWSGFLSIALWVFAIIGVVATVRWLLNLKREK